MRYEYLFMAGGVFALSAGAIINVIMNATNNVTFLEDQFWAQIVAENVLSEQKIKRGATMLKKNKSFIVFLVFSYC